MRITYDDIWKRGSELILSGDAEIDSQIDNPDDLRRGITLIFRPNQSVLDKFDDFLKLAEDVEPGQYIYTPTAIHTTVLAIITCAESFGLDQIDGSEYSRVIRSCVDQIQPFVVDFRGITASESCVMAQGFPLDNTLERFRVLLREHFKNSALPHSIDERYTIGTAHSTLIRFRKHLSRPRELLDLLSQFRSVDWGKSNVFELELVFNDWYHKSDRVEEFARFRL